MTAILTDPVKQEDCPGERTLTESVITIGRKRRINDNSAMAKLT